MVSWGRATGFETDLVIDWGDLVEIRSTVLDVFAPEAATLVEMSCIN